MAEEGVHCFAVSFAPAHTPRITEVEGAVDYGAGSMPEPHFGTYRQGWSAGSGQAVKARCTCRAKGVVPAHTPLRPRVDRGAEGGAGERSGSVELEGGVGGWRVELEGGG